MSGDLAVGCALLIIGVVAWWLVPQKVKDRERWL